MSKDAYLQDFNEFISEVSENCRTYTEEDWADRTETYNLLTGEWYEKFELELTTKEELKIASWILKWQYCNTLVRGLSDVEESVKSFDVEAFKQEAKYYIDNNMMDDIQRICEETVKLGEEAEQAVMDIINELNNMPQAHERQ